MRTKRLLVPGLLFLLYVGGTAATILFGSLNPGDRSLAEILPILVAFSVFAVVGLLVSAHHPSNPLGWLFFGLAVGTAWGNAAQGYAEYALETAPGSLPAGEYANWVGAWLWPASMSLLVFIILLYPTGRSISPRWRILVRAAVGATILTLLPFAFAPGPLESGAELENPLGIEALERPLEVLAALGAMLLLVVILGTALSLIVRSRRSRGDERQQLKWLAYGVLFMVGITVAGSVVSANQPSLEVLGNLTSALGIAAVPVATGTAILRYRLYDIDVVVNRTIVYAALTALLVGVYVGGIALMQTLLPVRGNDLAVAASTLAVAALFNPLRRRIQGFIDHYFYRRKYDAQRTIEDFAARLRDEIDIDPLSAELVGVVRRTMHPQHVSLWLRDAGMETTR